MGEAQASLVPNVPKETIVFESQPTSIPAVWLTGGADRHDLRLRHGSPAAPLIRAFGCFLKRLFRWSGKAQDIVCASLATPAPACCCPAQPCC